MRIGEIMQMPTRIETKELDKMGAIDQYFRCYHVLLKVRHWLGQGVPSEVILELIEDIEYRVPDES